MKRFPLLILITTLFSCSTDDVETTRAGLIKEVKKDDITLRTFEYDKQGRITNETTYQYDRPDFIYTYEYKGDTTYIDVTKNQVPWKTEKLYRANQYEIRRESYLDGSLNLLQYYKWEEETACGYTEILWDYANYLNVSETVIYLDENCSERRYHTEPEMSRSSVIEFYKDGMQAFDAAALPPPLEEGPGNVISSTTFTFNSDSGINTSLSYNSNFTYNKDNYPIHETRTYYNGTVHTYSYEYY